MSFTKKIISWYLIHKRDLPWRNTKNPYYIWLSEIILQQTQVKQGLPYYNTFVNTYPTVFDLANADEEAVLKLWQGLGYYSRARNLHATAKYIAEECNGEFPDTYKGLIQLKGVGDYTASAIASISFNRNTVVVDGNVYRVLSRYFGIDTPINSTLGVKEFKTLVTSLIDEKQPATFNQAIMEFGARQCKPKSPDCSICPLNTSCIALQKQYIQSLPVKLKKIKIKKRYFNFLVFKDANNNTCLEKREGKGIWQNLYQFPLQESEQSLKEEDILKLLQQDFEDYYCYNTNEILHKLSHQHLHIKFWVIKVKELPDVSIPISSLKDYPVPVPISNFIEQFNFDTA